MILQANPGASYTAYQAEIDEVIQQVLTSGWYILGKEVKAFEEEFATYCGVNHAIGVADGTNAIVLALRALGIGTGDEVITCGHTATATIAAIEIAGAIPVLADIDPTYYTIDVEAVRQAITPQTKAIIPVHIYGQPADMDALLTVADEHNLPIIEDCAQAHGAYYKGKRVGSMGTVATFSFYPTKNLGAFGDGGGIVTNDPAIYEKLMALRQYGWEQRYVSSVAGFNSRLDELQAAILRVKLRYLDADNQKRRNLAAIYTDGLQQLAIETPQTRDQGEHVFHLYVTQVDNRDQVMVALREKGVGTGIHYPVPNHIHPAYVDRVRSVPDNLPTLIAATKRIMSLPLYPELSHNDAHQVVNAIREVL